MPTTYYLRETARNTEYECHNEETETRFYFLMSRNNAKSYFLVSLDLDILHIVMADQLIV